MRKILIIEDEKDVARVLAKRLTNENFEVLIALDAYQGFSYTLKDRPDLVILDLMLPAGGGLSVLKQIRSSAILMNTPVIILTGIKDVDYEQRVLQEKVEAYFEKPYDFEKLLTVINKTLEKRKAT